MPFHILKELLNLNQLTFIEHCKIIKSSVIRKIFFKELLFNSLIINEILIILIRLLIILMWAHTESNRQRIYLD